MSTTTTTTTTPSSSPSSSSSPSFLPAPPISPSRHVDITVLSLGALLLVVLVLAATIYNFRKRPVSFRAPSSPIFGPGPGPAPSTKTRTRTRTRTRTSTRAKDDRSWIGSWWNGYGNGSAGQREGDVEIGTWVGEENRTGTGNGIGEQPPRYSERIPAQHYGLPVGNIPALPLGGTVGGMPVGGGTLPPSARGFPPPYPEYRYFGGR